MSDVPATRSVIAAAPAQDGVRFTFCRICEAFCGLRAEVRGGQVTRLLPDPDNPHSRGHVCIKGTSFHEVTNDPDRIGYPLRRNRATGEFEPVTWDDALGDIADRLAEILRTDGPDAVANYTGNPSAFSVSATLSIRPFFNHFGVWKTFAAATQDVSSRMMASYILYGSALRLPIPDLPRCDLLIAVGANMLVSHGSLLTAPRIREDLDAIAARGRVVVVDPRLTETGKRYDHLFVRPDSDAWLLAAMLNTIFDEGLAASEPLEQRTVGLTQLREAVRPFTPERAAEHCGVAAPTIITLAREFAATPRAAIYGRTGTCRGRFSTLVNLFICALNIVGGKFGEEGGWVFGDAAIDMAATRPGGHETRETRFGPQSYIGKNLHFSLLSREILTPGRGKVRALFVESGNIVVSAPGSDRTREALKSLDLFVSTDLYVTETNKSADYILPSTTFLEREDVPMFGMPHMVRPWAQFTPRVVEPRGEARDEHVMFGELGRLLHDRLSADPGLSGYAGAAPRSVDPMATADRLMALGGLTITDAQGEAQSLSVELLAQYPHGVQISEGVDCAASWNKLLHTDGRVHLWHEMLDEEIARMNEAAPPAHGELRLFSRRDLKSINSWMHNSDRLVRSQHPVLMIHPADAADRSIVDGQIVNLASDIATVQVPVLVTPEVIPGAVCYPHGWGHDGGWRRANAAPGVNINRLADGDAGERLSASSLLDGIRVTVTAA